MTSLSRARLPIALAREKIALALIRRLPSASLMAPIQPT